GRFGNWQRARFAIGLRPALLNLTRSRGAASYAQILHSIPETQVTTLDNGLRVASEESGQPTCTVGVWLGVGSRYENEKNNGAGYFLEHLAFKGTKNRPSIAFEKEVESLGAHLNGYTSREQTAYFIKVLSKDLPQAVEILADMVQNCSLEESQIEKERNVILQEMQEIDNSLSDVVFDYLHATAYQGTALSRTVEGTTENAKHLTRANLADFVELHYKAPRMVLAAAGAGLFPTNHGHYATIQATGHKTHIPVPPRLPLPGFELIVVFTYLQNLSSRLASIAVENKLCQSFQSFNTCYSDTGLFGFYFVSDTMNIEDTLHFAQGEWMRLCTSTTESEVKRAKNILRNSLVAQQDGTTPVCENIGSHLLNYERRIPLAEWDAKISAVDAETVREVCSKYLYDRCPAVAAVGPIEALPDYNRIRSAMYWLRL
uniref:Cytochrome b-c1 complex subunit 1, mitochondrial n=1 Tax=Sphenodon punctatus TaxID=8508 RepID=A0A8D0GGB2_SPHPU